MLVCEHLEDVQLSKMFVKKKFVMTCFHCCYYSYITCTLVYIYRPYKILILFEFVCWLVKSVKEISLAISKELQAYYLWLLSSRHYMFL